MPQQPIPNALIYPRVLDAFQPYSNPFQKSFVSSALGLEVPQVPLRCLAITWWLSWTSHRMPFAPTHGWMWQISWRKPWGWACLEDPTSWQADTLRIILDITWYCLDKLDTWYFRITLRHKNARACARVWTLTAGGSSASRSYLLLVHRAAKHVLEVGSCGLPRAPKHRISQNIMESIFIGVNLSQSNLSP